MQEHIGKASQLGYMAKTRQKTGFIKFVKLTDHTCACNNLTHFECEVQATGNGSYVNLQKLPWEKLVKSPWANLFFGGFF